MKSPRVFIKQGSFWVACSVEGQPNDWRWPTGIKLDPKFVAQLEKNPKAFKGKPDWWKASKHAPEIREAIKSMSSERELYLAGKLDLPSHTRKAKTKRIQKISKLLELVDALNKDAGAEKSLSPETIRRRRTSANAILRYDPAFSIDQDIDREWVADFRKWMKDPKAQKRPFTEWSQYTVLQDLKLFFKFGLAKRFIAYNPIVDINFEQPESLVMHTPIRDELDMFRHLYNNDIHRFVEFATQRLTGYRIEDIIGLRREHLDIKNRQLVNVRNIKGKRPEIMPMSDALFYLFSNSMEIFGKDYLFPDTYAAASKALKISAKVVGIKYTTHQCKRNYVLDIEDENPLQHIFDMLIHHKTKSIAGRHYTAQNIMLMRKTLNSAQGVWLTFFKELFANSTLWHKRIRSEFRKKNLD